MRHCYRVTTKHILHALSVAILGILYSRHYTILAKCSILSMQCVLMYNVYVLKLSFIEMWSFNTGGHYMTGST